MYLCPICGREHTEILCSCGYDESRNYENYPTLSEVSEKDLNIIKSPEYLRRTAGEHIKLALEAADKICHDGSATDTLRSFRDCLEEALELLPLIKPVKELSVRLSIPETQSRIFSSLAMGTGYELELREDGRVIPSGREAKKFQAVRDWKNITALSASWDYCLGLTDEGRVLGCGDSELLGPEAKPGWLEWSGIKAVSASYSHALGLTRDGRVLSCGANIMGQCDTSGWKDIAAVASGPYHSLGLRSDGSAEAAGYNYEGACEVRGWKNLIMLAAGDNFSAGLSAEGDIELCGNYEAAASALKWKDIIAIAASAENIIGLKPDGRVLAAGRGRLEGIRKWTNVIAIGSGYNSFIALTENGEILKAQL